MRIRSEVEGAANERANDRARLDQHNAALIDLRSDMMQLREENAELKKILMDQKRILDLHCLSCPPSAVPRVKNALPKEVRNIVSPPPMDLRVAPPLVLDDHIASPPLGMAGSRASPLPLRSPLIMRSMPQREELAAWGRGMLRGRRRRLQ